MSPAQPDGVDERLRAGDKELLRVPIVDHPVTVNEWHSVKIALSVGLFVGGLLSGGFVRTGVAVSLILIGYAVAGRPFGRSADHDSDDYEESIGTETLRREPWWFTVFYVLSIGAGFLVVEIGLPIVS